MRTKAKSRLTVVLILISFLVISVCSITAIFALTQQNTKTRVDIQYISDVVPLEAMTFTLSNDGTSYSVTDCDTSAEGTVIIPETYNELPVVGVGKEAFSGCSKIEEVIFQEGVEIIEERAFSGCTKLMNLILPESLITIKNSAFNNCSSLVSLYIPKNVATIGTKYYTSYDNNGYFNAFFQNKALQEIVVDKENQTFHSIDNCLIDTKNKTLIKGTSNSVIPTDGSVTVIAENAFDHSEGLTQITIPNTVEYIGEWAFYGCKGLTNLTIPSSVQKIDYVAFAHCTNIASLTLEDGIKEIESNAFSEIPITELNIPASVTTIGDNPFDQCSKLTAITVDENNQYFYSSGNCLIEKSSKTIISGCKNSVIPSSNILKIGGDAFCEIGFARGTEIILPEGLIEIGYEAFDHCSGLYNINFPSTLQKIGGSAFSMCNLSTLNIPKSVTSIGTDCFAWQEFNSIYVEEDNTVYTSRDINGNEKNCLIKISTKELIKCANTGEIPNDGSVQILGSHSLEFDGESRDSITIPSSVNTISSYAAHIVFYSVYGCNVVFEDPEGWIVEGIVLSSEDLQNSTTAADYLFDTYQTSIWKKS